MEVPVRVHTPKFRCPVQRHQVNWAQRRDCARVVMSTAEVLVFLKMEAEIVVRSFDETLDLASIQEIWKSGLSQTFEDSNIFARWFGGLMFGIMALHACGPWGDLGGKVVFWKQPRRNLFVAVKKAPVGENGGKEEILGCVACKEGQSMSDDPASKDASIFRLSVAEFARGHGVASLLMDAAEQFARDQGALHIFAVTGNPKAARLYLKRGFREDGSTWKLKKPLFAEETGQS